MARLVQGALGVGGDKTTFGNHWVSSKVMMPRGTEVAEKNQSTVVVPVFAQRLFMTAIVPQQIRGLVIL